MRTHCATCGAPGPFYASQRLPCYCIPCHRAAARARYAREHAAINTAAKTLRLRRILALPVGKRTRRQQKQVLDAEAPRGKKVCAYCWLAKFPGHFRHAKTCDGYDYYCRACRHVMDAQRHHRGRKTLGRGEE